MSQLRDRMIEDLRLRGSAENTINTYVPCARRFFEWAGVTPNKVNAGIVRPFCCTWPTSVASALAGSAITYVASDGTDNDFNGLADCDDPSCDGMCVETSEKACADGRDNDGDGMVDAPDPGCWPWFSPAVHRRASQPPTRFEERFDAPLSAATSSYHFDTVRAKIRNTAESTSALAASSHWIS